MWLFGWYAATKSNPSIPYFAFAIKLPYCYYAVDSTTVTIFVVILVEIVNSTNITTNIETAALSTMPLLYDCLWQNKTKLEFA